MRMTIRLSTASCNGLLEYGTGVTPFYWFTMPVSPVISAERRAEKTLSTPLSN